jgi:hypothetical protein
MKSILVMSILIDFYSDYFFYTFKHIGSTGGRQKIGAKVVFDSNGSSVHRTQKCTYTVKHVIKRLYKLEILPCARLSSEALALLSKAVLLLTETKALMSVLKRSILSSEFFKAIVEEFRY